LFTRKTLFTRKRESNSIMGALQPMHLIIVLAIVLLIFGPGKLPDLGRAIGDSMREFKRATNDLSAGSAGTEPAAAAISAICGQCKAPLAANTRFCGSCGASTEPAPHAAALV
jgi:sec-independent protein translocase protein TatA